MLGQSKNIRYSGDFVIARFVIASFVSTYFTLILPGFQMFFVITGSSLQRGLRYSGVRYSGVPLYSTSWAILNLNECLVMSWKQYKTYLGFAGLILH